MNYATDPAQSSHSDKVAQGIEERLASDERSLACAFAQLFWTKSPDEDLAGRSISDDVGVTIEN